MRFLWFWWNLTLTGKALSLLVVLGLAAGGWVLLAQNVEVSENGSDGLIAITTPTPAPTQQPSITPSPPPAATATPLPTRSPTPAPSPTPTARPAVTPSPTPIPTPRLTATVTPPGTATPTPLVTATPTPAPAPTGPGQTVRNVRITYTSCDGDGACGTMASGRQVYRGAAACNPSLLPFGTRIRIVGYSQVLTCEDISPALSGWYVVVWFPTEEEGSAFLNQVGRIGTIEVLSRR